jgi:(p)ppGpp synthase/HD superfamily hydrolase
VEDAKVTPDLIAWHFGRPVADVVLELSEPKQGEWQERKEGYIQSIRTGSKSAVLVSLADKYHNSCSYLKGAREGAQDGSQKDTERTLWFLSELSKVYSERLGPCYLVKALELCLQELSLLWRGETAHIVHRHGYRSPR